jgi:predicted RNA-binding Zn-ribbon protein involved in translation (DUF1610 family)
MSDILLCKNGNKHKTLEKKQRCTICQKQDSNVFNYSKIKCPQCNKEIKDKNLKYHKCTIQFNLYEEDAWEGDALHRLDSIKLLKSLGFSRSCSNTELEKLVSAESQVQYLLKVKMITKEDTEIYSLHRLSCIFEAKYFKSHFFREFYLAYKRKEMRSD